MVFAMLEGSARRLDRYWCKIEVTGVGVCACQSSDNKITQCLTSCRTLQWNCCTAWTQRNGRKCEPPGHWEQTHIHVHTHKRYMQSKISRSCSSPTIAPVVCLFIKCSFLLFLYFWHFLHLSLVRQERNGGPLHTYCNTLSVCKPQG